MSESPLLPIFQKAYQNTDLTPLIEPEQLAKFWVEYGREALESLVQLVEDHAAQDAKVIFSGHRGCGKSTLLAEFGRTVGDRYFVTFFSISDLIEMSDVNHINILFAIAVNLILEAEKQQIEIPKSIKDSFYKCFAKRTRAETNTPTISEEISVKFDFKLMSRKLKQEPAVHKEIKQDLEFNVSDLITNLNQLATTIKAACQKDVLVIIDDLDKLNLDNVYAIFLNHIKTLFLPRFSIIYTIPIESLQNSFLTPKLRTDFNENIVAMNAAKIFKRAEQQNSNLIPQEEMIEFLCQFLYKRIPENLLELGIAKKIVLKSGGLPREIIRIANRCCRICLLKIRRKSDENEIKINQEVLEEAIKNLMLDFEATLGKRDYEILIEVHKNLSPKNPKDQNFLDLLNGLQILEYHDSKVWYCVHPIVKDILEVKGLI
jgi:energy-coupling factor transporter ATP-binding protein EcfA2